MAADGARNKNALGFLTVVEHQQHGLFGGYLLLNAAGRPLEFHCTAPIKPNRAQEILYGPTLASFLYGDQIGRTLLEKARIEPALVCTDREPVLAVRQHVALPVALVLPSPEPEADRLDAACDSDTDRPSGPGLTAFRVGRNRLAVPECSEDDRPQIIERLGRLGESLDLAEPFGRIREAIDEAQHVAQSPSRRAA